jgi:peptidoglycan/LPS O-acetylase OafA/YrhL
VERRSSSRWEVLALARFVLAMIVFVHHLDLQPGLSNWWTSIGAAFNSGSAVYGFLLISGYSIAASLDRESSGYVLRRVKRIYPTYLAALGLGALAIAVGAVPQIPAAVAQFAAMALMLQTFAVPTLWADGQLWTIAVEWWCYMAAPLLRRLPEAVSLFIVTISLAFFLIWKPPAIATLTIGGLLFDALAWLWIAGFLYYRHRGAISGYALLAIALAASAAAPWRGPACLVAIVALVLCERVKVPTPVGPVLGWLGDLSYPLYAVHVPVFFIAMHWGLAKASLVGLAGLGCSIVVLHAIDLPVRRLRLTWPLAIRAIPTGRAESTISS